MSKDVLQAIRPEWCEKIISGEKTVEVRKNRPSQETPFKVYIYCTIGKKTLYRSSHDGVIRLYHKAAPTAFAHHQVLNGKVIGEYVCNGIGRLAVVGTSRADARYRPTEKMLKDACMSYEKLCEYGGGASLHGWGISQLKIYEKPLELKELGVLTPPESWRYVDEKGD